MVTKTWSLLITLAVISAPLATKLAVIFCPILRSSTYIWSHMIFSLDFWVATMSEFAIICGPSWYLKIILCASEKSGCIILSQMLDRVNNLIAEQFSQCAIINFLFLFLWIVYCKINLNLQGSIFIVGEFSCDIIGYNL